MLWLAGLIQDWAAFCRDWRGHRSRLHAPTLCVSDSAATEPSLARQEHCFNRLLCKVSKRCRSVDEFQSSALVQPTTLIYAIRHLRNLTWMDLKDSQELSDDIFNALADNVRFLSYLRLSGSKMRDVTTKAVADLILAQNKDTLSQFKVIHGNNIFEDTSILKAIGQRHGRSMQRLTLAVCDLEDSGLQEYGPLCQGLLSINLEYSSGVTDDILLPILDACNQLVKLDLTETDCTQATIQGLSTIADSMVLPSPSSRPRSRFASMRRLILNNIDSPFTTNLFLPLADACPELEELHMNSILADSFQDFSQFISKMKRLLDLDIGNVFPEFSDSNLISLVDALPGLRWLSVANTQITNVSLVYLAEKSYALCDLCILGCDQVTKTGLLEFLDKIINKTGFKRLDITYCRLDDGAVAEIRERAKHMAIENGTTGAMEIEGDDQFADNVVDDDVEREEGEESDDEEAEETDDSDDDNSLDELFEAAETAEEMADALHDIDTSSSVIDLESLLGSFVSDTSSTLHSDEEVMSNYSDISDLEADDYGQ
ncbi:hypothetical protein BGZ99_001449 [Dissophora globulifera]|uniref:RNI-like protein n=1 Tax=Dissophora globulifera TaxID=979702 RepID=A0A9P6RNX8_9FUNG|nr:hypothetical protein BGZ99_001449 [Dissophora globulifera]